MSDRPPKIGILDSGVGGLSVLREIHKLLPFADLHYIGDSAWCPYGNKPTELIQERVTTISRALLGQGADVVVIACNSATIQAVRHLRAKFTDKSFVGMEPGVKPAAKATKTNIFGVLATEASIKGERFEDLIHQFAQNAHVISTPCPKFVDLVERGELDGAEAEAAVDEAVLPMLAQGADTLVLGCTHYPFLAPLIRERIPENVQLIDTGSAVARRVAEVLPKGALTKGAGTVQIQTTGELAHLQELLPKLLGDFAKKTSTSNFSEPA